VVNNDWNCDNTDKYCDSGCNCGAADTGDNACYVADLDHTNAQVQSDIKAWLAWYRNTIGFKGWRFDMVKGYSASFVGGYIAASNPLFSVGEYWDDNTASITTWIQGTGSSSKAFDFPNRDALSNAVANDNYNGMCCPPGVMDKSPAYSVPFTDNHDTARDDRFGGGSWDNIKMGYAYILTHPGVPCIFWTDWNDSSTRTVITKLISIRAEVGVTTSGLYIYDHTNGLYSAIITAPTGKQVAVKLGSGNWDPSSVSSGWTLALSGNRFAVWMK